MNNSKQILIADDNSEIREIVRILLESENYEVFEAVDGQDAIDKVTEETDLIILDMMMPNKSGLKACLEIREKTSAPILFLTAKTQDYPNPFPIRNSWQGSKRYSADTMSIGARRRWRNPNILL